MLSMRIAQGLIMIGCIFTAVKSLPLVYVALISNLGPLLIAVFSFFLLRIGLSKIDTVVLIVSFIGVCFLVTGALTPSVESVQQTDIGKIDKT